MISDTLLKGVYLFGDLSAEERGRLAKIAESMALPAGFQIFRAGEEATALYLIKDGSVRITTLSPSGERIDVATLGSGSHFGEMALIDGAKRSASAETLEATTIFRFDYGKIQSVLNASETQSQFDAGERTAEHEVVEKTEMADAKHLAREPPQARAKREVEALQHLTAKDIGVVAVRRHQRGQRVAVFVSVPAQDLEAPHARRAARCLAVAAVAREYRGQAFREQHVDRFVQAIEEIGRRRVGKVSVAIARDDLVPAPVRTRQPRGLARRERLVADGIERQARRQHQSLLRARDGHVDTPFGVAVVDRGERRNGVDHKQRRMLGAVDRLANKRNAAGDARRRLVVHDH